MPFQLTGSRTVRAERDAVWAALHDPACLKLCVPGCSALERVSVTRFDLSVLVPLGPVSVTFAGTLEIARCDPLCSLLLEGRGTGGLAGLAIGRTHISLTEVQGGCRLGYRVEAEPSGPFAAAGTILLSGLATTLVERFATTFATIVERKGLSQGASTSFTPRVPTN